MKKDPFIDSEKGTTFGERLKQLIGSRSGRSFAKDVNISYSTLHNYLTNTSVPTLDNLVALAEYTGVSLEWLATGTGMEQNQSTQTITVEDDFVKIDDFRDVRISAGFGADNDDYIDVDTTKVESSWLAARRLKAKDCAMFLVSGDSMYPTLKDGEEIIVDRSKKDLTEGKIFVINHGGSMLVKKIQFSYDGIELISDNSTYRPIQLTADEANSIIVIGQVVRGYRDF